MQSKKNIQSLLRLRIFTVLLLVAVANTFAQTTTFADQIDLLEQVGGGVWNKKHHCKEVPAIVNHDFVIGGKNCPGCRKVAPSPLIIIDGKEVEMSEIPVDRIKCFEFLKKETALEQYGDKAKNGVMIVELLTDKEYKKAIKKRQTQL